MPLRLILQTVLLTAVAASGRNGFAQDQTNNANDRAVAEWTAVYRINLEENLRWMLARERAKSVDVEAGRKIAVPRVGVFADFGVWHLGARSIVESLEREDIACQVIDRTLLVASKLKTFDAVILPGGWAPFQLTALDESQQTTLKKFVSGGGRCIGVCAGAYLVSRIVRWEAKDYPYPLELFDGIAAGPVSGLADWPVASPVRLTVTAEGRARRLETAEGRSFYYKGGSYFLGGTTMATLARYPNGSSAVISVPFGKGEVVLSGVHFERPDPTDKGDDAPPPAIAGPILKSLVIGNTSASPRSPTPVRR